MRRRIEVLGTATSIALAAVVLTAAPAEARRNVGGFDSVCDATPGQALAGKDTTGLGATQVCFTNGFHGAGVVIAGPNGK